MPERMTTAAVAVLEDVWGPEFEALGEEVAITRIPDGFGDPERLVHDLVGVQALVVRNRTQVDRTLLAACPSLLIVGRAGVGLDNIDVAAADDLGVVVSAAAGANAVSVAEHALGTAIALSRELIPLDRDVRGGAWNRRPGRELYGRTWGVVGYGATGRATATLARGLGMNVVAYDPFVTLPETKHSLAEVAAAADVLSIHLPSTSQTRHLVDEAFLAQMKPDAILINVGRGEVVDEAALAEALIQGRLHGASLDVRTPEPPRPGPLDTLDNVVLSPHVAGITRESQARIAELITADVRAVLNGGQARGAVGVHRTGRGLS